jgi:hypothetical protein
MPVNMCYKHTLSSAGGPRRLPRTRTASLVDANARLSSAGLAFVSRAPAVARVSTTNGRAVVQGVAAGRTWVVVRSAAASDSVQVIVQ